MSWVDDIRCLYCDGRLPLYRKITNGQFCSGAHRKAYWKEHERLAVERLHQTHDSLRAYRPPGAVEWILGASAAREEILPLLPVLDGLGDGSGVECGDGLEDGSRDAAATVSGAVHLPLAAPVAMAAPDALIVAPDRLTANPDGLTANIETLADLLAGPNALRDSRGALRQAPGTLADETYADSGRLTNALPGGRASLEHALHSVAPLADETDADSGQLTNALPDGRAFQPALHSVAPQENSALPPDPPIAGLLQPPVFTLPHWLPDSLAAVDVTPLESTKVLRWPFIVWARRESTMAAAPAVPMAIANASNDASRTDATRESTRESTTEAGTLSAIYPNVDAAHPRITLTLDIVQAWVQERARGGGDEPQALDVVQMPAMAGWLALPGAQARETGGGPIVPMAPVVSPAPIVLRAQLPLNILQTGASLVRAGLMHVGLPHAGLRLLPVSRVPRIQSASLQDGLRAIDLRAGLEAPLFPPPASPVGLNLPRLSLAAGSRYRVETQGAQVLLAPSQPEGFAAISTVPPRIALPERSVKAMAAGSIHVSTEVSPEVSTGVSTGVSTEASSQVGSEVRSEVAAIRLTPASHRAADNTAATHDTTHEIAHDTPHGENPAALKADFEPSPTGLLPIAWNAKPSQPATDIRPAPPALSLPQPLTRQPMRPDSKLEPLDSKPASDGMAAPQGVKSPQSVPYGLHWTHAIDFWNRAPRDLKMLVFAIPLLWGLALHPALPKVRVTAPAAANGIERNVERAFNDQWVSVKQTMFDRAAVALDEDFRSGLDDWTTRGDATAAWSFDATGFVRPGPLALYRPSMNLTDYQMQFLGVIDKQALSWVVRAADFDNFYVVKLMVLKSGPLPTIGVVRYAVVDGKADSRVDTIAAIDARTDMLYRVRLDVHGDDFALSVQGQMVDSWSEPRLRRGGIGFFSARGEESRLRWVQVTHQYDMLGRLCAYLAPYNVPTASGSWQP